MVFCRVLEQVFNFSLYISGPADASTEDGAEHATGNGVASEVRAFDCTPLLLGGNVCV